MFAQNKLNERAGIDRSIICCFGLDAIDIEKFERVCSENEIEMSWKRCPDEQTGIHIAEVSTGELIGIDYLKLRAYDVGDLSIVNGK